MKTLLKLFLTFLKIGAFTFGGGYAMIPLIAREAGEKRGWITEDGLLEIIAIAESTPGPIAVNASTYIGYQVGGLWGAIFSTLGVVLPSFLIITVLCGLLETFGDQPAVHYAFFGIRAAVLALIVKAFWGMFQKTEKNASACFVMASAFVFVVLLHIDVIYVIIGSGLFGLIYALLIGRRLKK